MKRILIVLIGLYGMGLFSRAQDVYHQTSGEVIFSFADVEKNGASIDGNMRFTLFYHTSSYLNVDFSNTVGLMAGFHIRNVGFITRDEVIDLTVYDRVKRRSYTMGLSAALKLGSFRNNTFLYGGAEYEWLFHYKEKWFLEDEKVRKMSDWFSDRTETFVPSFFVGIQLPRGINVKFKYYMEDFMNHDYINGSGEKPYEFLDSRVFYVSLTKMFNFKDFRFSQTDDDDIFL